MWVVQKTLLEKDHEKQMDIAMQHNCMGQMDKRKFFSKRHKTQINIFMHAFTNVLILEIIWKYEE